LRERGEKRSGSRAGEKRDGGCGREEEGLVELEDLVDALREPVAIIVKAIGSHSHHILLLQVSPKEERRSQE